MHLTPILYHFLSSPHIPYPPSFPIGLISLGLQLFEFWGSLLRHCSASASTSGSNSNYDRPNRLKGREDGNIRWVELLEKFRSVQDRARRAQRHNVDGEGGPLIGLSELRLGDGTADSRAKDGRGLGSGPPAVPQKDAAPAPPAAPAKKSGLGRQFGRLGGAALGKNRRN